MSEENPRAGRRLRRLHPKPVKPNRRQTDWNPPFTSEEESDHHDCGGLNQKENALLMAIFRSLKALIKKNPSRSKTFLTTTTCTISAPCSPLSYFPSQPLSPFGCHSTRLLSPLSKLIIPFHGPLFLQSPPWKLSQSATPLYVQGNRIILRRVEALNSGLNLLRRTKLPLRIGFGSVSPGPNLLDRLDSDKRIDELVHGVVNLPNLISVSRLISGPFLGW